jgi:hypothetical protein
LINKKFWLKKDKRKKTIIKKNKDQSWYINQILRDEIEKKNSKQNI